VKVLAN